MSVVNNGIDSSMINIDSLHKIHKDKYFTWPIYSQATGKTLEKRPFSAQNEQSAHPSKGE